MNSGARLMAAMGIAEIELEWGALFYDARWMLLLVFVSILADFRFGWEDSRKRYNEAKEAGDTVLADKYRWHLSRAVRRTMCKLMDYTTFIVLGLAVGMGLLDPVGVNYMYGGVAVTAVIVGLSEMPSVFGHFFHIYGVQVERKTLMGFLRAFSVALARRKNPDVGDALEEGFKEMGGDGGKRRR